MFWNYGCNTKSGPFCGKTSKVQSVATVGDRESVADISLEPLPVVSASFLTPEKIPGSTWPPLQKIFIYLFILNCNPLSEAIKKFDLRGKQPSLRKLPTDSLKPLLLWSSAWSCMDSPLSTCENSADPCVWDPFSISLSTLLLAWIGRGNSKRKWVRTSKGSRDYF